MRLSQCKFTRRSLNQNCISYSIRGIRPTPSVLIIISWAGLLTIVGVVVSVATLIAVLPELADPPIFDGLRCVKAVPNLVARLAAVVALAIEGFFGDLRAVRAVVASVAVVNCLVG